MIHALVVMVLLVPGQETDLQPDLGTQVKKLVAQLNGTELAERDEAEKQLLALGPSVLEFLPSGSNEAELRLRLERIRQSLGREAAEQAVAGATVTCEFKDVPVSQVLSEFEKQTGNKIIDYREQFSQEVTDPKVSVSFDKTPFWQALDSVLDEAELAVYPFVNEKAIALVARDGGAGRSEAAHYSGSFRFQPLEITARRDLRGDQGQRMTLTIEASWEPRISPIFIRQEMAELKALDEAGKPLTVSAENETQEINIDPGVSAQELILPFELPNRESKKIASLKGTLHTLLPGGQETFRFTDVEKARNVEQKKANVTVVLESVRKNNELWEARVRIRFEKAANSLESHRGWVFNNPAYFEGPDKKRVNYSTVDMTRQTEEEVGFSYLFAMDSDPKSMTFIYQTPSVIIEKSIDFELKDIELP